MKSASLVRDVYLLAGARTPFLRSEGAFSELMSYELAAHAIAGLLARTPVDPASLDRVVLGTVLADPRTTNLAREASLAAGVPNSVPAFTVTAACVSAGLAMTTAVEAIASGAASLVLAGGAESLSDAPIRFRRAVRKRLMASRRARGPAGWLRLLRGLSPSDLLPEVPALAEFTTGLTMGQNAERLAKRLGISRAEQDAFALSSHRRAAAAAAEGRFAADIVPVRAAPSFAAVAADDGIRADGTEENLARLSPAFDRSFGTVTAASSSFLTDGAAVCLLGSADAAKAAGLAPLARVAAIAFSGLDPLEELLLGPAVAIPRALDTAGVRLTDVGVLEIHEAFAVPVLAALRLLADDPFCRVRLGRREAAGKVDPAKVNAWGGSLSLGHPFGATAARLLTTCARRMQAEGARWGVSAACAAGGLGHAVLLERM